MDSPTAPRRARALPVVRRYEFGRFAVDMEAGCLLHDGVPLHLAPKAFELLTLFVRNPSRLLEKETILSAVWPDTFVEEANLSNNISILRKSLGDAGAAWIETVPKRGYRFTAELRVRLADSDRGAPHAPRFLALPFRELTPAGDSSFLAHSLPEAVSHALSVVNSLIVRSSLAAGACDPATVDCVLAGTLIEHGGQVEVAAELLETEGGTILWSAEYRAGKEELFGLKERLVDGVVSALSLSFTEREQRALSIDRPASPRAYEYFLRANAATRNRGVESMGVARDLYAACLDDDPAFAPAWVGIGRCHRFLQKFGDDPGPQHAVLAEKAVRRAFELNPDLGAAHSLLTLIETDAGCALSSVIRLLEHARHRHTDPDLFVGLVQACRYAGLWDASLAAHRSALVLDPNVVSSVAHTWFVSGDYELALEEYKGGAGFYMDAAALAALGRDEEALARLRRRRHTNPSFGPVQALMDSLEALLEGDGPRASGLVDAGLAMLRGVPAPETQYYLARHVARLGDLSKALSLLAEVLARGFLFNEDFGRDPWLSPVRDCPGFELVKARAIELRAAAEKAFLAADGLSVLSQ